MWQCHTIYFFEVALSIFLFDVKLGTYIDVHQIEMLPSILLFFVFSCVWLYIKVLYRFLQIHIKLLHGFLSLFLYCILCTGSLLVLIYWSSDLQVYAAQLCRKHWDVWDFRCNSFWTNWCSHKWKLNNGKLFIAILLV